MSDPNNIDLLGRFLDRRDFDSYEDFIDNYYACFSPNVPDNFTFTSTSLQCDIVIMCFFNHTHIHHKSTRLLHSARN